MNARQVADGERAQDHASETEPVPRSNLLVVEGLSKRFGGLEALSGVAFSVHKAEVFGVIGPNGAGKTTLFNILSGFQRPDSGTIRLAGQRIDGMSPEQICRCGLVRTFQTSRVFPEMSVVDNVAVGAFSRVNRVAAATAMARRTFDFFGPRLHGYAQRPAGTLSWANRARVEMARALACQPHLLALDEPTAGMNPVESNEIVMLLRQLKAAGMSVLLIEHNMRVIISVCDRMLVLHHGVPLMIGTPAEVKSDPRVLDAYLGATDGLA